ncbi:MAG: serine/threonine-protein kinase, partial [Deltaproteobacteria bacterium]|nr:serine/threonine-protein kinase [Deltaproteobacteria bacterium]
MADDVMPGHTPSQASDTASNTEVDPAQLDIAESWASPQPGDRLGRYRVQAQLGRGAMGVVYAAEDEELQRNVALKIIHPHRCTAASARRRFTMEAEMLARVTHPNVVGIYDFGSDGARQFFVMERIDASTLQQWLRSRTRSHAEIIECFRSVARGLAAAHAAGVVHRDFKPSNVLIDHGSVPKVTDFGLAMPADGDDGPAPITQSTRRGHDEPSARSGLQGSGTPAYMAIEQHRGEPSGPAADQYAFFIALFEAMTGSRPFRDAEKDLGSLAKAKARGLSRDALARLPRWLRPVVTRGLAPAPEDRFESMDVVASRLRPTRTRSLVLAGLVVAGLALSSWATPPDRAPCSAAAAQQLDEVWAPVGKPPPATSDAPQASRLTHGKTQADQWRGRWTSMRVETCEAARRQQIPEFVASARRACLQQKLRFATGLLDQADQRRWVAAASQLPAPEQCRFVDDRLADTVDLPPEVMQELETLLAEAKVASATGDFERALSLTDALQRRARALGATRARLAASALAADAKSTLGDPRGAESLLEEVIREASGHGMAQIASDAASSMAWIQGVELGDVTAASLSTRRAQALAEQTRESANLQAVALLNLSSVMEVNDQFESAHRLAVEAREILEQSEDGDPISRRLRAGVAAREVVIATQLGRHQEAAASMDDALSLNRREYGDLALPTLSVLGASAEIRRYIGDYEHAAAQHAEMERAFIARDGPSSAWISVNAINEARLHVELWDFATASQKLEHACGLALKSHGPDSPMMLACSVQRLDAQMRLEPIGDRPGAASRCAAIDSLRAKLATREDLDSHRVIRARTVLAGCWARSGQAPRALTELRDLSAANPIQASNIAWVQTEAHEALGDTPAALASIRRGRELLGPRLRPAMQLAFVLREASLVSGA